MYTLNRLIEIYHRKRGCVICNSIIYGVYACWVLCGFSPRFSTIPLNQPQHCSWPSKDAQARCWGRVHGQGHQWTLAPSASPMNSTLACSAQAIPSHKGIEKRQEEKRKTEMEGKRKTERCCEVMNGHENHEKTIKC